MPQRTHEFFEVASDQEHNPYSAFVHLRNYDEHEIEGAIRIEPPVYVYPEALAFHNDDVGVIMGLTAISQEATALKFYVQTERQVLKDGSQTDYMSPKERVEYTVKSLLGDLGMVGTREAFKIVAKDL